MTDLDRLLEKAKTLHARSGYPWLSRTSPETSSLMREVARAVEELIERVKKAEAADWDSHYEAHTKAQVQLTALEAERDALIERVKEAEKVTEEIYGDVVQEERRALKAEARLRAAEEVVEQARGGPNPELNEALRRYDEAVTRVKE